MSMRKLLLALLAFLPMAANAAMKVSIVSATAANGTPTYTQDFTDSTTFAGATPKCAIVLGSAATAENSSTANIQATIGFVAAAQASVGIGNDDAVSPDSTGYANYATQAYSLPDFVGNTAGDATGALIANGVRLSWTDQSQGELVKVILIGGDVECAVASLTSNNTTGAQAVTHGLTAAPQAVIAMSPGQASGDSGGNAKYGIGFWDGTNSKALGVSLSPGGQTTVPATGQLSSTVLLANKANASGFTWTAAISNVGATTFDITLSANSTSLMHFLSLRSTSGTALGVKAGTFATKTSTGTSADIASMSQSPQVVLYALSRTIAVDTNYSGVDDATNLGLGVAVKNTGTGSTQYATIVNCSVDGALTSTNHAYTQASNTQAIRILDAASSCAADVEATINSWDSGGITNNYSNIAATGRQVLYLAIGADVPAAPTFSVAPAIGTRTTSTIPVTATTACTDCTFHGVALADGGSATCAEIDGETATGAYKYFHQAMTADAQGTGTFSTYTDGTVRDGKFCLESTANGYSAVSSIADMYKKAAFSVTPSVTAQDDNDYTITKTLDGPGSCTVVACLKDSTAPTVTQILAGNCAGDAAAIATVTDASCEAGTMTLGGSLTRPIHDIYVAGTYGSQPSDATTLADEMLAAPAGYQYDLLASVGSTSPCAELNPSITPDIAAADVTKWSSTVSPSGDTLTAGTDCEISYPDPVGNWRSATLSVYDTSAGDWMSGGPTTVYFNYPDPTCSVSGCELIVDQVVNGGAFTAIDVCAMFTDPAGGALTCTSSDTGTGTGADKRPAGTTVTSGVFDDTGAGATSTGNTEGTFSVTATNVAGGTASINVNWFVYDQVNIPDCVGLSLTACGLLLDALNLDPVVTLVYDAGIQIGYVVSQGQAAGTEVDPFTEMDLTVSLGAGPSGRRRRTPGLGVGVGRFVPEIDFDSEWWRGSYGQ